MLLWLFLNFYFYVLALLGGAATWIIVSGWCHFAWFGLVPLVYLAFIGWVGGVGVAFSYPVKLRMYRILVQRNKDGFRLETFRNFVDAPCHRLVVRAALLKNGQGGHYREVMRAWYRYPWQKYRKGDCTAWLKSLWNDPLFPKHRKALTHV